jgi:hypothetical protein
MFDLKSIKEMNDRAADAKAREALRRGSKKAKLQCPSTKATESRPLIPSAHSK